MPDGTVSPNPMRVVPAEGGAEVIFTVRRRPDMSTAQLDEDAAAVAADLKTLRGKLERA